MESSSPQPGVAEASSQPPAPSALSKLIASQTQKTPPLQSASLHSPFDHALALQVLHNLQYQHEWTALQVHARSPLPPFAPLPRPLLSGMPPRRLYIHPDEQIELLKEAKKRQKSIASSAAEKSGTSSTSTAAQDASKAKLDVQAMPEREWVLPARLKETWSLKKMSEVFDCLNLVPPPPGRETDDAADGIAQASSSHGNSAEDEEAHNKWRTTKRVLMAIVDDDSTIVYYIVHDGIVKPRQN
jgi:tRNA-splicing endonuclease subunit Sen15, fungi type